MKWFSNMKIRSKLLFGFSVMILLMLLIGGAGYYGGNQLQGRLDNALNVRLPAINYLVQADRDLQQLLVAERSMIFADVKSDEFKALLAGYEENLKQAEERMGKYAALASTVEERELYKKYLEAMKTWAAISRQVVDGRLADTREGRRLALDLTMGDAGKAFEAMRDHIDGLQNLVGAQIENDGLVAHQLERTVRIILVFAIGLGIVIGLLFAWGLSKNIGRPIAMVAEGARRFAVGDIQLQGMDKSEIAATNSRGDELGDTGRAFGQLIEYLSEKVNAAEQISKGNLNINVKPASQDDVLGHALKAMVTNLNQVIGQVRNAAEQVTGGADQISGSSQALSQGATEQAASLEEITSSMTEVGSQTKANAENAAEANRLASSARDSATDGNETMKSMVSAMSEINNSSGQIAKIIKTIDDIAFQTNLLALNAAVEAARAGKHGKGFAVVAQEVRNLAGRSAKAASETADLIDSSVKTVENGSEILNKTATALEDIVKGVTQVSDLIGDIAAASNEQAQGISQINQGLQQVEQVTQQNTANAEQSASAAEELSAMASQLRDNVSRFRLLSAPDRMAGLEEISPEPTRSLPEPASQASPDDHWGNESTPEQKNHHFRPSDVISLNDEEFGRF